jgi:uncharacterized membrane protein (GlpM family)
MGYLILKAALTGVIVIAISEISKRSSIIAAVLASLPLTSILAFIWMYADSKNGEEIKQLSYGIFWMVIPSLAFFILLPTFLKVGMRFYPALLVSSLCTAVLYTGYAKALTLFNVKL